MPKKRILIFIDWFYPGYRAGGPISSNLNLIEQLKDEFEFFVITRDTDYCESVPYNNISPDSWNKLENGSNVFYISKKQLSFSKIRKIIQSVTFDIVFINGIYSLYFSIFPLILFKYFKKIPLVVSARGMLSDHTFSSKKFKKKLYYVITSLTGLYKGVIIHATNDEELQQIRKNLRFKGEIRVAPNLPPKVQNSSLKMQKLPGQLRLISVARISPEKNILFALKILQELARRNTQDIYKYSIVLDLFGIIYNQAYWDECKKIINSLPVNIQVTFFGPLEKEKVNSTIQKYHFLFMPSQGENYGHSIVESFMAGRPVIISDKTPWKDLQVVNFKSYNYTQNSCNDGEQCSNPLDPNLINHPRTISLIDTKSIEKLSDFIDYKLNAEPEPQSSSVGWDLPLNDIDKWIDIISLCILMDQNTFDSMCTTTINYAVFKFHDPAVLSKNTELFII